MQGVTAAGRMCGGPASPLLVVVAPISYRCGADSHAWYFSLHCVAMGRPELFRCRAVLCLSVGGVVV